MTPNGLAAAEQQTATSHLLDLMELTDLGAHGADRRVSVRRDARAGCVFYGPFWQLRQGSYRLSVECRTTQPLIRSPVVIAVEVIADMRHQVAWRDFTIDELIGERANIDFAVPRELSGDAGGGAAFEFRVYHFGNAELSIGAIDLCQLAAQPANRPPRRWRLSGPRDARRSVTLNEEGFVSVPRGARAGQFARGVRSLAMLPAGRYRLRFRCRTGRPRRVSRAVMSVEIVNGNLSHQSYFYAAGLAAGSGQIDFTVPEELSVEGGAPAPVAVRFVHLGNAALSVGEIELEPLDENAPLTSEAPNQELTLQFGATSDLSRRFGWPFARRRALVVDPLRLQLPAGAVRLTIRPHPGVPSALPTPPLRVELSERPGWRRLLPPWRAAGRNCYRRYRWELAAHDIGVGRGSTDDGAAGGPADLFETEVPYELRVAGQLSAALPLTRVDIRKVRADKRKNVVIIGNCHVLVICQGFLGIPVLQKYFRAKCQGVNPHPQFYDQAKRALDRCDLAIVQDIADWEDSPLQEWVRDGAEVIKFPCVRFASLWPFDQFNSTPDAKALALEGQNLTFPYLDGLLARLRKEIPDRDARFNAYRSLEAGGITNYVRAHQFESRRLLAMDKKFSCEIGQFILDRFRSQQDFYTTNHPNGTIFAMVLANIMRSLGLSGPIPPLPAFDQLHSVQVPVPPKVAEALGVAWATPERTYRFRQEQLTWEQYVRRYIACYG